MNILIINGANLNLLGSRETNIYGETSMEAFLVTLKKKFSQCSIEYYQSNIEGEIINRIQKSDYDALIINPGAYTHYSYAIFDALQNINTPKIEVHISHIYKREEFRQKSVTASACDGIIAGFGLKGYALAIEYFLDSRINEK